MTDKSSQNNNLEQSLERLETLVDKLEKGDLSLEESLSIYEEGVKLSKRCQDMLTNIEKSIETIHADNSTSKEDEKSQ